MSAVDGEKGIETPAPGSIVCSVFHDVPSCSVDGWMLFREHVRMKGRLISLWVTLAMDGKGLKL